MLSSDRWMPGNVWSPTVTAWMCISSADTAIIENGPTPSLMVRLRPLLGHPVNGVLSLLVAVVVGQRLVHSWYRRLVRVGLGEVLAVLGQQATLQVAPVTAYPLGVRVVGHHLVRLVPVTHDAGPAALGLAHGHHHEDSTERPKEHTPE